ncbi:MAG TPA: stalk domain-containing protein [Fimbriimonadaceae bacterium]|nr:stalk domain-containing protein [Fimbriimonadaceae bacterium]
MNKIVSGVAALTVGAFAFAQSDGGTQIKGEVNAKVSVGKKEPVKRSKIMVTVDGDQVRFPDQEPAMRNNRVLVPVRGVFEKIGAQVQWLPERQMVVANHDGKKIELWINQRTATVAGAQKELDQPAIILNGRAMVPLRFLSESMGADVDWIAHDMHVKIVTD